MVQTKQTVTVVTLNEMITLGDLGDVVITMKDFEWLVKSSNLSLVEIKERLDKCLLNNFSTLVCDDELQDYLEVLLGHATINFGFPVVKEIVSGVCIERGVGNFKFIESLGIHKLNKKSLKKLINSKIKPELIGEALERSHYMTTNKVKNLIAEDFVYFGVDTHGFTDDQMVVEYIELIRKNLKP